MNLSVSSKLILVSEPTKLCKLYELSEIIGTFTEPHHESYPMRWENHTMNFVNLSGQLVDVFTKPLKRSPCSSSVCDNDAYEISAPAWGSVLESWTNLVH